MKTLQEWEQSGLDFRSFAKRGDQINKALYEHFLFTVPPVIHLTGRYFLYGEPVTKNEKGETLYMHFYKRFGKHYYGGIKTKG